MNIYATSPRILALLVIIHCAIIAVSNYLVQIPLTLWGFHTTWGALTFPLIFLATDLTVRLLGKPSARRVIFYAMMPALLLSYYFSTVFFQGDFVGHQGLTDFNLFVFRIVIASFTAYVVGQVIDIFVFERLRRYREWWVAPLASSIIGGLVDTAIFFSIAFYKSSDAFMAENWIEIASLDYAFKLAIGLLLLLPAYGVLLNALVRMLRQPHMINAPLPN